MINKGDTSNLNWLDLLVFIHIISLHDINMNAKQPPHRAKFSEGITESTQDELGHGNILPNLLKTLME